VQPYVLQTAESRDYAQLSWLSSFHSFSFTSYHDDNKIGLGLLCVLNDVVAPGKGFGAHPHQYMEIILMPASGALLHKDNTGRHEIINTSDVQIMSAGSGINHSETNASNRDEVRFFQIWIYPKTENTKPAYAQQSFTPQQKHNVLLPVVSPNGVDGSLPINQDAWIFLSHADAGISLNHSTKQNGNGLYVFIIEGEAMVNDVILKRRDAIGLPDGRAQITTSTKA